MRQFKALYQAYKDTFDIELLMRASRTTYADLKKKADQAEEWF